MTFEQKMGLLDKIVKELDLCNELNGFIKELEGKVEYIESSLKGD